jgi:hypothetical protein
MGRGQLHHGLARQAFHLQPTGTSYQLAKQEAQLRRGVDLVVAEAADGQGRHRSDPRGKQRDHVQGRLVSPVEILDHEQRGRPGAELGKQRAGHLVRSSPGVHQLAQLGAAARRHVDQRSERMWRSQRLTGAPQDPDVARLCVAECPQQGGLADSGLAADQDEPPLAGGADPGEQLLERGQVAGAFQKAARDAGWNGHGRYSSGRGC